MANQLFELRGTLPSKTYLMIEIIGFVVLLGIWQLIASIGSSETHELSSEKLQVYYSNIDEATEKVAQPYVLVYAKEEIISADLLPLFKDLADSGDPLLLLTNEANRRSMQSIVNSVSGLKIMAASPTIAGDKRAFYQQVSDFTGTAILDEEFIEEEQIVAFNNYLGGADWLAIGENGISLGNNKDLISNSILPSPVEVFTSFKDLYLYDDLVGNTAFSIFLNVMGYLIAVAIALPFGFLIGLFPLFRALFSRQVDALRFVPLTAVTGLFIAWFGIGSDMKILFLAFGIIVYLLPIVVQRVDEVDKVYTRTAYTLGASKWQQIKTVFIPAVFSKVSDDVRVLVAISWTYIIVAELLNKSGGIGALVYTSARKSEIDKVFAILVVIILIGFIQDKLFVLFDRLLFPHKHQQK